MASANLTACSALHGMTTPGRYGARRDGLPGVTLTERTGIALALITARKGKAPEVSEALAVFTHRRPQDGPRFIAADGVTLIGCAPGQWLGVAEGGRASGFVAQISQAFTSVASVTDESSARVVLRLSGPRARDVLAKGCPIDLHARAFQSKDAATTRIAHIDCTLWQTGETPAYDLAVGRSFAESFWFWLTASAAEYGYEIRPPVL